MFAELTTEGWIFMSTAWLGVIALTAFCLIKVLKGSTDLSDPENN